MSQLPKTGATAAAAAADATFASSALLLISIAPQAALAIELTFVHSYTRCLCARLMQFSPFGVRAFAVGILGPLPLLLWPAVVQ